MVITIFLFAISIVDDGYNKESETVSGMLFMGTRNLDDIKDFYISKIGMDLWLEQEDCIVLQHGNLLLGFCTRKDVDTEGIITFFYDSTQKVDEMYVKFRDLAIGEPKMNDIYQIYHFFTKDPENRKVEFQYFLNPVNSYLLGDEVLVKRRSIRHFEEKDVPEDLLRKIFELCRYSPTSRNSESYYYVVVRDRKKIEFLASLRGSSSAPIKRAPLAIAVAVDPEKTRRLPEDGCIAAYHFILAAKAFGLGTCWIAAMDRDDAKKALGIPKEHYIATITPLGYPAESPQASRKRSVEDIVTFIG